MVGGVSGWVLCLLQVGMAELVAALSVMLVE